MSPEKSTSAVSQAETRPRSAGLDFLDAESVRAALVKASAHAPAEPRWWRDVRRRRLLALADCCAVGLGLALALPPERAIWMIAFLPAWVLVAKLAGLYDADHRVMRHLTVDEAPVIFAWGVIGAVAASMLGGLTPAGSLSTSELALTAGITIAADFVLRVAARAAWRTSTPRERALIVGEDSLAHAMRRKIVLFADLHMDAVEPGDYARGIDRVVLAHERIDAGEIAVISDLCHRHEAKLSLVSPLRGQATPHEISRLAELPVFEYLTSDVSRSTMMLKRALDLIVGIPLAILAAPLFPLIAIAIWLEDRGPILFAQQRAGFHGAPFRLLKFRTMHVGADSSLEDLLDELPEPMFKFREDPRVTRVGRTLRRLSLDELPQIWNLLRGDMSLVGPRPEQLELVERYSPEHRFRLDVKPGLTGPMQVHGRGELTFEERLAVELDYVENLSIGRDLRILALTPVCVIRGTGAF
ncbi:MAG TPA: sugar transferase [Solirubrobacterales bacterium]|jgi:exopolysaccharide biosynthesis polyprenyl glycosylphosphotransferase|nr:sugar transferase [Solirubrobacterales bacterium]